MNSVWKLGRPWPALGFRGQSRKAWPRPVALAEREQDIKNGEGENLFSPSPSRSLVAGGQIQVNRQGAAEGADCAPRVPPDFRADRLSPQSLHLHKFFMERVLQNYSPFQLLLK